MRRLAWLLACSAHCLPLDPPTGTWVLDEGEAGRYGACPTGQRNAAQDECLAACQAAAVYDGLAPPVYMKVVGAAANESHVPLGCSYSRAGKNAHAIFNSCGGGCRAEVGQKLQDRRRHSADLRGKRLLYRLACISNDASADGVASPLQPTRRATRGVSDQLILYTHIPKTGGASFVEDVTSIRRIGLSACAQLHLGKSSQSEWENNIKAAGVPLFLSGGCDFFTYEYRRAELQTLVQPILHGSINVSVTELVLLREPTTHVPSMFMHCQMGTGMKRHKYERTNISQWLSEYAKGNAQVGLQACAYDPRDHQVCALGEGEAVHPQITQTMERARAVVRDAFFVGILEHYGLSLCLLGVKLHGLHSAPVGCQCSNALVGPELTQETHTTHGTQPEKLILTGADLGAIGSLTTHDRVLYSDGLLRFLEDVKDAGLGCWLEMEAKGATDQILQSLRDNTPGAGANPD